MAECAIRGFEAVAAEHIESDELSAESAQKVLEVLNTSHSDPAPEPKTMEMPLQLLEGRTESIFLDHRSNKELNAA
jgi:hypothetical protein